MALHPEADDFAAFDHPGPALTAALGGLMMAVGTFAASCAAASLSSP